MDTSIWLFAKAIKDKTQEPWLDYDHRIITTELYWSFFTDLTNVIGFAPIAKYIIESRKDLIEKWLFLIFICSNGNLLKKEKEHVMYDPNTWRASFCLGFFSLQLF